MAGLSEEQTMPFVEQISMIEKWDVLEPQDRCRKLDGLNAGIHELFTPNSLLGELRWPVVIVNAR